MAKKKVAKVEVAEVEVEVESAPEKKVDEGPSPEETSRINARLERERRRYICRRGGFRVGLPQKSKAIAGKLNKKLGKKESDGWDFSALPDFTPGIDHPSATQNLPKV